MTDWQEKAATLADDLRSEMNDGQSTTELEQALRELMHALRPLIELTVSARPTPGSTRTWALDQLTWIADVRSSFLDPIVSEMNHWRDGAIRAALASGMSAPHLSIETGLSTPRIYQVRDGRR